jgi:AcrR family transcriptional regulator
MSQARSSSGSAKVSRPYDAAASKQALFDAARQLFGQKGFEQTTLREIGQRAGVDPALVSRYFGSKGDLYVAVVAADRMMDLETSTPEQLEQPYEGLSSMVEAVLRRSEIHGPGPILQALLRLDTSEEVRLAGKARLERRLIEPLAETMAAEGVECPRLRAEVAVSALLGISVARSLGWFDELSAVPKEELGPMVAEVLSQLMGQEVTS